MGSDTVRQIARNALAQSNAAGLTDAVLQAFDVTRLRSQMVALGMCDAGADDAAVTKLYFSRRCSAFSPNPYFDETWYRSHYVDIDAQIQAGDIISGFIHFMIHGLEEGRWPNQPLFAASVACLVPGPNADLVDQDEYLRLNPAAAAFLAAFPGVTARHHYNNYGRFLNYAIESPDFCAGSATLSTMRAEFDPVFYGATYLAGGSADPKRLDPFQHYATIGMQLGHSPNEWFDEEWYRAFYREVRDAITAGQLPCGFYHYLVAGRGEGRLPRHNLTQALELRMPGVTNPALLASASELRQRLEGLAVLPAVDCDRNRGQTIWFFLPTLNPDIMFGGYRAAIELMCALRRDGHEVGIVCADHAADLAYFNARETSLRIKKALAGVLVLGLPAFIRRGIGVTDMFVAYSIWDLRVCAQLAEMTSVKLPFLLTQEYEPVFYDNGARRAICESLYSIPHYPIINSGFLLAYLQRHRIGAFAQPRPRGVQPPHSVFEHKIAALPRQKSRAMAERRTRLLAVYARPEAHAARNMFELIILALEQLCAQGAFGPEWSFVGLGALSDLPPVRLGGGHQLVLHQKMAEQDYQDMAAGLDIGISLMAAPHPSVMPFEFATTGALVVTNVYENRSAAQLKDICENIVPCKTSIEGLVEAIRTALDLVPDTGRRARNAFRPPTSNWDTIFSRAFISATFEHGRPRPAPPAPSLSKIPPVSAAAACADAALKRSRGTRSQRSII